MVKMNPITYIAECQCFNLNIPKKLVAVKKSLTAFSMKVTTTFRDNNKVNQIEPIKQEHPGFVLQP